ncbi:hypothetical protein COCNU_01G011570 [Cocos nucifera]|uniref:Uncharacterized protein n=1 Tax=Cocos nucifera TaxID=13894 RepID=A0A8K0MV43_COCNU|nr:hypothetical protein COCNU_01G011570 [Cocos nucifera]
MVVEFMERAAVIEAITQAAEGSHYLNGFFNFAKGPRAEINKTIHLAEVVEKKASEAKEKASKATTKYLEVEKARDEVITEVERLKAELEGAEDQPWAKSKVVIAVDAPAIIDAPPTEDVSLPKA